MRVARYWWFALALTGLVALSACEKDTTQTNQQPEDPFALEDELVRLKAYRELYYGTRAIMLNDNAFYDVLGTPKGDAATAGAWLRLQVTAITLDTALLTTSVADSARFYNAYSYDKLYQPIMRLNSPDKLGEPLHKALTTLKVGQIARVLLPSDQANATGLVSISTKNSVILYVALEGVVANPEADEAKAIKDYIEANKDKDTFEQLPSGVYRRILRSGDGKSLTAESNLYARYEGYTLSGSLFDTNDADVASAHGFVLSSAKSALLNFKVENDDKVISGYSGLFTGLPIGSKIEVIIPSGKAYGETGNGQIQPWQPLRFIVTAVNAL